MVKTGSRALMIKSSLSCLSVYVWNISGSSPVSVSTSLLRILSLLLHGLSNLIPQDYCTGSTGRTKASYALAWVWVWWAFFWTCQEESSCLVYCCDLLICGFLHVWYLLPSGSSSDETSHSLKSHFGSVTHSALMGPWELETCKTFTKTLPTSGLC